MSDGRVAERTAEGALIPVGPPEGDLSAATDGRSAADATAPAHARNWHASREDRLGVVEKM